MSGPRFGTGAPWRLAIAVVAIATAVALTTTPANGLVGGVVVDEADHPYHVGLHYPGGTPGCGGVLVAPDAVLTAAHCIPDVDGTNGIHVTTVSGTQFTADATVHPLWNGTTGDGHDLAVLWLPTPAPAPAETIQVGRPFLPDVGAPGDPATLLGYGRTSTSTIRDGALRRAQTDLRSDGYMESIVDPWWQPFENDFRGHLMLGAGTSTTTVCSADSGSPLLVDGPDGPVVLGIASFLPGDTCDEPGVYAELSGPQLAWVASTVPGVTDSWGPCQGAYGVGGTPVARYGPTSSSGALTDGSHHWQLYCDAPPPIWTMTTTTLPDTGEAPVCLIRPWLCDDWGR